MDLIISYSKRREGVSCIMSAGNHRHPHDYSPHLSCSHLPSASRIKQMHAALPNYPLA